MGIVKNSMQFSKARYLNSTNFYISLQHWGLPNCFCLAMKQNYCILGFLDDIKLPFA